MHPTVSDCRDYVNNQDYFLPDALAGISASLIGKFMTVYAIVQLKMTDRAAYDRYQERFFAVFRKFSGRLLSADESPAVLEGEWECDKVVLMSFPDETSFRAWANSAEYLEISKDRKAGAQAVVLLAKGVA
jgi:uncharacterized protein (DUF1330 family)